MASYHVLHSSGQGRTFSLHVEYHIPVPDVLTKSGRIGLQTAIQRDTRLDKESTVAERSELADLADGKLLKQVAVVKLNQNRSFRDHQQKLRETYDELAVTSIEWLHARYAFTGFSETKNGDSW